MGFHTFVGTAVTCIRYHHCHHDDPFSGPDGAAVPDIQTTGWLILSGLHRAGTWRRALLHFPATPILYEHSSGYFRRGPGGWLYGFRHLFPDYSPLARPALAVVGLFIFMWAWNDYIGLDLSERSGEIHAGPGTSVVAHTSISTMRLAWPYLMAASTMTILPILIVFFFVQRTFIEGITLMVLRGRMHTTESSPRI